MFLSYCNELEDQFNLNCTPYYYLYKISLLIFGESFCDSLIRYIKRLVSFTPTL